MRARKRKDNALLYDFNLAHSLLGHAPEFALCFKRNPAYA